AKYIASHGYEVGVIHGDLDDRTRRQTLRRIKDLHYQYVVASDIASRGIDIEGVSHVINFDLPQDIEFYVHRTGRTARFEMRGQAISLYDYDDEKYVNELKKKGLNPVFVKITDQGLEPTVLKERKPLGKIKQIETMIHAKTPMPKKVKPGYKKKRKEKIEKEIRTLKREYVSSIYRKKKKYE
ncbi:MAG TPA: C-terminal helicase domain-containing protein, partial [Bacilli bacterium]|nr:C-terminal helicase domain-containing protein [Bacilli bacterium]